ncbi:sterile alpha motif domain-containing protein 10 isoform X1 [Agelaius tricolor]|uniref:sterile alpha motif domain-containing protein 10 isoform X1 n=1 Tax=Agelaius tricolor TaxID=9191 RepID=UPI0039F1FBE7
MQQGRPSLCCVSTIRSSQGPPEPAAAAASAHFSFCRSLLEHTVSAENLSYRLQRAAGSSLTWHDGRSQRPDGTGRTVKLLRQPGTEGSQVPQTPRACPGSTVCARPPAGTPDPTGVPREHSVCQTPCRYPRPHRCAQGAQCVPDPLQVPQTPWACPGSTVCARPPAGTHTHPGHAQGAQCVPYPLQVPTPTQGVPREYSVCQTPCRSIPSFPAGSGLVLLEVLVVAGCLVIVTGKHHHVFPSGLVLCGGELSVSAPLCALPALPPADGT